MGGRVKWMKKLVVAPGTEQLITTLILGGKLKKISIVMNRVAAGLGDEGER